MDMNSVCACDFGHSNEGIGPVLQDYGDESAVIAPMSSKPLEETPVH